MNRSALFLGALCLVAVGCKSSGDVPNSTPTPPPANASGKGPHMGNAPGAPGVGVPVKAGSKLKGGE